MRKRGLAQDYKAAHKITNHKHPTQSPDLNPTEAIWNIIKQRLRRRLFDSEEEVKQAFQEEWNKITLKEIRDRKSDILERCARLERTGGKPIETAKW